MKLDGKKIGMLLGQRYQDEEAGVPLDFFRKQGAQVDVISISKGKLKGLYQRRIIDVARTVDEVNIGDYDALIIPGGRSPAWLRKNEAAVRFVREFYESGKPVAAICHGPQLLAEAGVLKDKKITGYYKIKEEMLKAGARFYDEPVVVDGNLITSREPGDLGIFNDTLLNLLSS